MWISIDEQDSRPLYLQIILQIKEQLRQGTLKSGDELPSVRELADSLGINMHTVRSAYLKLQEQGIITLRLGRRATIARRKPPADPTRTEAELQAGIEEAVTDALLAGLSTERIRTMVQQQLDRLQK
jgi:GntR family transcriptional regulator